MKRIPKRKINIGIVCSPWLGGSGVVGSELARYLARKYKYKQSLRSDDLKQSLRSDDLNQSLKSSLRSDYKVVFIGSDYPFRLNKNEVYFHKVEAVDHALFENPLSEVALVEGIVEAVIEHKLDIIHAHFAIPFAYSALQAREILKKMGINIKVVTTLHGTDVLILGRELAGTMKYVLEQSNAVTAVSVDLARRVKKIYHTQKTIQVIYNFIDLNEPQEKRANLLSSKNIPQANKKIFVHISNFRPIKRVADTLKVFSKIQKKIPSILLLIGKGPEIEIAKGLSKSINSNQSVYFLGSVKNPYQYLGVADGLIVTSQYESFCLVGLEAMAFGVPVFSTKVGGIPEVIKHGKSGYLVEKGDIEGLARHIIRHFSNNNAISYMKKQAKEVANDFAAEKIIPQYEQIYQQLISPKSEGVFQTTSPKTSQ